MACVPTCFLTHLLTLYSTCLLTFYLLARQVEATGIAPAYTTSCNASCVLLRRTAQPLPCCRFRALQGHTLFGKARASARRARCVAIHVPLYVPVSINHSLDLIGRRGASREIPVTTHVCQRLTHRPRRRGADRDAHWLRGPLTTRTRHHAAGWIRATSSLQIREITTTMVRTAARRRFQAAACKSVEVAVRWVRRLSETRH